MDCCSTFQLIFYFLVLTNSLTQFEVQGQTVGSPVQGQGRSRGSRSRGPRIRGGGSPVDGGSMVVANRGVRRNEPLDIKFSDQWETQSYSESAYGTSIKDGEVVSGPLKSGKEKIEPLPSGRKRRPAKGKFTEFQIENFDDFVQFDEPLVTEAPVSNLNVDFSMMDTDVDNADPTFNREKVLEPEIPVHQEFSVPEVARTSLSPPTVRTPPRPQFQQIEIDTGNVDNSKFTTQVPQMIRYPVGTLPTVQANMEPARFRLVAVAPVVSTMKPTFVRADQPEPDGTMAEPSFSLPKKAQYQGPDVLPFQGPKATELRGPNSVKFQGPKTVQFEGPTLTGPRLASSRPKSSKGRRRNP